MENYKIPLRNRKKEIIDYTYVSKEDYELLNQYRWYKSTNYIKGTINNKKWLLHRYIMIELLKNNNISSKIPIDHIDNNTLNNKRDNLRIVSISENIRNRVKKNNTSSKYTGVYYNKKDKKWVSSITINNKQICTFYDNEHYAAYQYNLWCKEYNLITAKINIILEEHLKDFKLYIKKENNKTLPKNITIRNNKYILVICGKHIGIYKTVLEALITRNFKLKEIENKKQDEILNTPIKRNKNGQAIIEIFNKNKEKISETIVDDNNYYELTTCCWNLSATKKYIQNRKIGLLHRYIMKYTGKNYIDHINNNPLDNRIENLRIVTSQQNNFNKKSNINSSSQYIGVHYDKKRNKWSASITINGKKNFLGRFINEIDAAKARDIATKKYFGEYGNLNFT